MNFAQKHLSVLLLLSLQKLSDLFEAKLPIWTELLHQETKLKFCYSRKIQIVWVFALLALAFVIIIKPFFTEMLYYSHHSIVPPGASRVTQCYRICLPCRRCGFNPWVRKIPWRRKWQPTQIFLPGKSQGQRSLVELQFIGSQRIWYDWRVFSSVQFSSVTQSCPTLYDPMNRSTPGLPVHHQLPEFTQTHVHRVSDAIQPSHPQSSPSPPALNPSQHQSLFQWVNSSHEVAKVLEFHL